MTSCLYKCYYHNASRECKIYYFFKNLTYRKSTVVKIIYYLLLLNFMKFFFCHKFFLKFFSVEFSYFLSFMMMKIFLIYKSSTEQSLQQHIFCFLINSSTIHRTNINIKSNDYCTAYLKDTM